MEKCTIKFVNNKWRAYDANGKELCAYTVKMWTTMYVVCRNYKIVD